VKKRKKGNHISHELHLSTSVYILNNESYTHIMNYILMIPPYADTCSISLMMHKNNADMFTFFFPLPPLFTFLTHLTH